MHTNKSWKAACAVAGLFTALNLVGCSKGGDDDAGAKTPAAAPGTPQKSGTPSADTGSKSTLTPTPKSDQ